ncbi:hypothetical protein [Nocardia sp. NPDC052566]|uniref:hypothetical protein n=1 Tax=Nocardia sp. NPDC052566 TaxID=3364330 RepID=UPI0037C54982
MPDTKVTLDFSVARHRVALTAPPELIDDVVVRVAPYLTAGASTGTAQWTVQFGADPRFDCSNKQQVVLRSTTEPEAVLWVDHRIRRIVVAPSTPPGFAAHLAARYLRIVLRLCLAASSNEIFPHAGMVARPQRAGVVVLGPKRAGKTSTLLSAMISGAVFVGNDDVSIARTGSGWIGRGWPRAISVRRDTFDALGIRPENVVPTASGHPGDGSGIGSVMLLPSALAGALRAPAVQASAPVTALVFPQFAEESPPKLRPLARAETARRLLGELLPQPVKQADFLLPHFSAASRTSTTRLCNRLAAEVPAFELRQNFRDLRSGAARLTTLLD